MNRPSACRHAAAAATLRPAGPDDAAALAAMGAATFLEAFGDHPGNRRSDVEEYVAVAYAVEKVARDLAHPAESTVLAESAGAGELVGFASLWQGPRADGVVGDRPVELRRLYVAAGRRGAALGSTLMAWALDEARRLRGDVVWLGVWEHNPAAQRFYRRWGFEKVGETGFRLGPTPQTDWVMARSLADDAA